MVAPPLPVNPREAEKKVATLPPTISRTSKCLAVLPALNTDSLWWRQWCGVDERHFLHSRREGHKQLVVARAGLSEHIYL